MYGTVGASLIKGRLMKDIPLDWNDLKVLLALSRLPSFSAAARSLQVDQSTVSRRLAAIERAVGFQVLIRGSRDYGWTGVGKKLVDAASKAETAIRTAQQEVRSERQTPQGTVNVVLPPGLIVPLSSHLAQVPLDFGNVNYAFVECTEPSDDIYASTDIVVRYSAPTAGDLIAHFVCTQPFALYAAKSHLAIFGVPQSVEALTARPLVVCEAEPIAALKKWRALAIDRGLGDSLLVVENLQSAEQLIGQGFGIGVLPKSQGESNVLLQRLDLMAFEGQSLYLSYHVALKKSARVQAAARQLRSALDSMVATPVAANPAKHMPQACLGAT